MRKKIAINGFGRIGRAVFKNILEKEGSSLEIVAVNDLTEPKMLAHLLQYDSLYGRYKKSVSFSGDTLLVNDNGKEIKVKMYAEKDPSLLPWRELGVDVVLECTGFFTDYEGAKKHIYSGAKKVIISAPSKDPEKVQAFVLGVNEEIYDPESHDIVDMGSCTTNCLAPLVKVLFENYGIESGMMTTVHSYTANQNLHDGPHKDLRRARAAGVNIIPTTTGAAKAIGRVIPEVDGLINGLALRIPTPTVSIIDFVCELKKEVTKEEVKKTFKIASEEEKMKNILKIEESSLVSTDYIGSHFSSIVDAQMIDVKKKLVKILAWYDNEWGYSSRLTDFAKYVAEKI